MSKWKLSLLAFVLLAFPLSFYFGTQTLARPEEERQPQIDVEDYNVEAELIPSAHQIKAKAVVRFISKENSLSHVIFELNSNLRIEKVYLFDKPPAPGAVPAPATESVISSESQVPRLTRRTGGDSSSVSPSSSRAEPADSSDSEVPYLSRRPKKDLAPKLPVPTAANVAAGGAQTPSVTGGVKKKPVSKPVSPPLRQESDPNFLRFTRYAEDHTLQVDLNSPLSQSQSASLVFEYSGSMESAENSPLEGIQVASVNEEVSYLPAVSRWFPLNKYFKDRATGTFRITVPQGFVVAMDGTARPKEQSSGKEVYTFVSERATFPGTLAAAKYNVLPATLGKVEVVFYVKDNKRDFIEAHTEVIGKILDLYSEKFGLYPGKSLKLAVIDNNSLLGYSAPGIELIADRAFDRTPNTNLLAKEIAYQWWQNLIVPKAPQDLWLKEGFSAYSALLFQESISSEAGFVQQMKDTAVAALLHEEKSTIRNAYQLQLYSPEYNSILKSKGAYVLHMLRGVMGDENFFKLMKEYVYNFGYQEGSIQDFKALAEKISGQNLTYFFSQWIEQNGVPQFQYEYTTYRVKDGFKVSGTIKQDLDTFRMPVEIVIETEGKPEIKKVEVVGSESPFSVPVFGKPRTAKIDPNFKVLRISDDIRVAAAIAKGDELRKLGEPTESITEYQKAIDLNKRSSLAFFRIGETFFEQRSHQSAANSFREALNGDLEPKWIEVWCHINLGKIFDVLSQRERALREYQKALDTNDNTQGAQEIAQKYLQEPYKIEGESKAVQ